MRVKRRILGMVFLVVLLFIQFAVPPQSPGASKKYLSLGTGNPGGTFYFIGAGFANLFNKYVSEVRVIAESTAASEENFNYILRKKMDIGLISISVVQTSLDKKMDMSGVRLMALGHSSDRHWFVRKDSPVKTFADFRGRRVAVGPPGGGTLMSTRRSLAECCGLTFEDFKPVYLSFTESVTGIKDGAIDVGTIAAGVPVASLLDLSRQMPLRLISMSEKEVNAVITTYPFYVRVVIPAGTYQGINTDAVGEGGPTAIFCRHDLSEDLVYKLMKALYDHPAEKDSIHPQAKQWNFENMYRGAEFTNRHIPFHPGAIKYLKEKGVWKEAK